MKKLFKKVFEFVPVYVIIPLIAVFSFQSLIYFGTKLINHSLPKYDLTTPLDSKIPILPWFAFIYVGCYLFWAFNYMMVGRVNKEHFYRFISNIFLGYIISGIIFCIFPTFIVRPDLSEIQGLGKAVVAYVYNSDTPVNLFPSMHCQISWYCYLGVRKQKEIAKSYQYFSLIMAILVCISTVVIRQHYVVDIFAGIAIAELSYFIARHTNYWKVIYRFFEGINGKVEKLMQKNSYSM